MTVHVIIVTLDHAAFATRPQGEELRLLTSDDGIDGTNRFALKRAFEWLLICNFGQNFIIVENAAGGRFLTPFLAVSFGKNCSDEAK